MNFPIASRKNDLANVLYSYVNVQVYTSFYYSFVLAGTLTKDFDGLLVGTEVVFSYSPSYLRLWYRDDDTKKEHRRSYECVLSLVECTMK